MSRGAAVLLLLLAAHPARADDDPDEDPPHITVRGVASAEVAPDTAVLRLDVEREDADAATAARTDVEAVAALVEALKAQGVAAGDIEQGMTRSRRAPAEGQPSGSSGPAPAPRPIVNRVVTQLRLRLHDPAKVGATLAALGGKGETRVAGIDYGLADPGPLLAKLTGAAVADARRRAEAAASAANVKLGALRSIEPPDETTMAKGGRGRPGQPGFGTYSTSVEVTYAIIP